PSAAAEAAPPVSRSRALFSVRSGRLMMVCASRMGLLSLVLGARFALERGLELLGGSLGEDERLVAEDVVDVEALGRDPLRPGQVARAADEVRVVLGVDDQDLVVRLRDAERGERGRDRAGLAVGGEAIEDDDL